MSHNLLDVEWDLFPPGLGCLWPRLGWGEEKGCLLLGSSFTMVSPLFNTPRLPVCLDLEALAAPRTGHIGHSLEKVAAADSGFPEVPLGVFGESPVGLVFPPPWFLGVDFWVLLGCMWPACTRHPAGLEHACSVPRLGPAVR